MNLLITGGTGSLGQQLTKLYLDCGTYDKVVIYSRDEQKQELMYSEFCGHPNLRFLIGDIRDKDRLRLAMEGINAVVHCAALKIVPAMEYNPIEAVKTNVIGSQNLIEVCSATPSVRTVLAVSTDKAVHPVNLYGATKLTMEKLILAANNIKGINGPRYGVVRYGNVAGSRGSVIPKFKDAVHYGQPLRLTHKDMTRFWITIKEAAKFVADALYNLDSQSDFNSRLYIPAMSAFNVYDLAKVIGGDKSKVEIIGVRPGEKLHEQIMTLEEANELGWVHSEINSGTAIKLSKKELQNKLLLSGLIEPCQIPQKSHYITITPSTKSSKRAKSTSKKVEQSTKNSHVKSAKRAK